MSLRKWIKKGSLLALVTVATASALALDYNVYLHHNITYKTPGGQVYEKIDGIFSYTQLTMHGDGSVRIARHTLFSSTLYNDSDNDGDVDSIELLYGPQREKTERIFLRAEHERLFPELFRGADEDFQEQMERFGMSTGIQQER